MTTPHASGFTTAEFAELHSIATKLHGEWFPQYDGVHRDDLPLAAQLAFDLEQLVGKVANRQAQAKSVQDRINRANSRYRG